MPSRKLPTPGAADPPPARHVLSERFADPDLVDRIFQHLLQQLPELAARTPEIKEAIRAEFGGETPYVRSGTPQRRTARSRALAAEVLALFNGRNATQVARELGISRATVYRLIKQPGVKLP